MHFSVPEAHWASSPGCCMQASRRAVVLLLRKAAVAADPPSHHLPHDRWWHIFHTRLKQWKQKAVRSENILGAHSITHLASSVTAAIPPSEHKLCGAVTKSQGQSAEPEGILCQHLSLSLWQRSTPRTTCPHFGDRTAVPCWQPLPPPTARSGALSPLTINECDRRKYFPQAFSPQVPCKGNCRRQIRSYCWRSSADCTAWGEVQALASSVGTEVGHVAGGSLPSFYVTAWLIVHNKNLSQTACPSHVVLSSAGVLCCTVKQQGREAEEGSETIKRQNSTL